MRRSHLGRGSRANVATAVFLAFALPVFVAHGQEANAPADRNSQTVVSGRPWALLIGVEDYQRANDLPYVKNDVTRLAQTLNERGGLPKSRIRKLVDDESTQFLPNRDNLLTEVPRWLQKCRSGDQVLVYFSGHGVRDAGGTLYLAPNDVDPAKLAETCLSLSWFRDQIADCEAGTKILILDACHAGTSKGNDALPGNNAGADAIGATFKDVPGVVTLASSTAAEESQLWPQREQSLFSYWLNQGLKGHADRDADDRIDVDELFQYVRDNVTRSADQAHPQHPVRNIGPDVEGVPAVTRLQPMTSEQLLNQVTDELAWAMKDRGLKKLAILEFTNDGPAGELWRSEYGALGRDFAAKLRKSLLLAASDRFDVVETGALSEKLKSLRFQVGDLQDRSAMKALANGPDGVPAFVHAKLYGRSNRLLNLRCELKDTAEGALLASAGGPMELTPNEWAEFGRSAVLPADAYTPPRPAPRADKAFPNIGVSEPKPRPGSATAKQPAKVAQSNSKDAAKVATVKPAASSAERPAAHLIADQVVAKLDEAAKRPHPLTQRDTKFRVKIMVEDKNGRLAERPGRAQGNDFFVTLRKGEVYQIWVYNEAKQRALLRLLVDGLNTMLEDATGSAGEQLDVVEINDPAKGAVRKLIGKRVSLDEAKPWVLDPQDSRVLDRQHPLWRVPGFASGSGTQAKIRKFTVVDASQSKAAQKQYTDQIGLITAAFYAPRQPGDLLRGGLGTQAGDEVEEEIRTVGGNNECGNLLAVIHIRYGQE